jgi:hypothetical protein
MGARCTVELKRNVRKRYQRPDDLHVFGLDAGEEQRASNFVRDNHDLQIWLPLVRRGIDKSEAARRIMLAGIEIPEMYRLGFPNANCIGCPKGQHGYWNRIRTVFPEVFERMAKLERRLDVAINKSYAGDGERKRVFLDKLDPEAGNLDIEPDFSCGIGCGVQADLFDDQ